MWKVHPDIAKVPGLREAVAKIGLFAVARELSKDGKPIRPQSLYRWERVPPRRCQTIHRLTGIPLHELRPDVYPPPGSQAA